MKNKIIWASSIVGSGYKLGDKISLLFYFLCWPLRRTILKNMKLPKEVVVKNKDGIFFCGKDFSSVGCVHPSYEPELRNYFDINEGVFIDIGANVGKYSILVAKKMNGKGKVIAIEPEKRNFEILKKNVDLNNLDNVILINSACSNKSGKMKFFLDERGTGTHSFYKTKIGKIDKFMYVGVKKLDDIIFNNLEEKEIKDIRLIKIDVEGAESEVIEGSLKTLKKSSPKILVEAWNGKALRKVEKNLSSLKYKKKKINQENYLFIKE